MLTTGQRALAIVFLLATSLFPSSAIAQGGKGRFFLSWNAPYGERRAAESRTVSCGDSSGRDTLFVCFEPGPDSTRLIAVDAEIRLWPSDGDTLDRHWWFESRSNPAHLIADFNLADSPSGGPIWEATGAGGVRTVSKPDTAYIRMVWAVREADAAVVWRGQTYAFARLIIPRPVKQDVCAKPLCFELAYGRLAYDIRTTEVVRQGKRFVSWNPGSRAPCAERVQQSRIQPWRPAGPRRR